MDLDDLKRIEQPYLDLGMKIARNKVLCPAHGGNTVDCSRNENTGHIVWKCFSCGQGGSILDAYKHKHNVTVSEAFKQLMSKYGDGKYEFKAPKRTTVSFEPAVKIEKTSRKIDPPIKGYIVDDGRKLYVKDAKIWKQECLVNGKLVAAATLRWDLENEKIIRQAYYDGEKWKYKGFPWRPIPLYNEEKFDQAERIIFVEGEKCKDKLTENIDIADICHEEYPLTIVTTNFGGSNAIKKANIEQLKGKEVYFLRDNDEPGEKMMKYLQSKVGGKILNPALARQDAPEGYDIYDYLVEGYPVEAIYDLAEDEAPKYTYEDAYRDASTAISTSADICVFFEKLVESEVEMSNSQVDELLEKIKNIAQVSKSALKADWKEISGKGQKKDWPDLVMQHTFQKQYQERIIYVGKTYWFYDNTHWRVTNLVGKRIYDSASYIVKPGVYDKASAISKAEQLLMRHCAKEQEWLGLNARPKRIINVKNGEIHIDKNGDIELTNHNPESKLTYCIGTAYNPEAECPLFDKAVRDIFQGDEELVRHFEEVAGYMIFPDRFMKNFFVWWGPKGNNGKTTLTSLVKKLMGQGTSLTAKIHKFGNDNHDTFQLVGKMLLVDDDMEKGVTLNDGLLKEISELKQLTANPKNKDTFPFTSYAAVLICCNNLPRTNDITEAMRSRANFIPFYRRFSEDEIDKELFPKIEREELSGVLNRFLAGLQRLIKRGGWDYPEVVLDAKDKWLSYTSSIYDFMTTHFMKEGDESINSKDLRIKYVNWCEEQGIDQKYRLQNRNIKQSLIDLGYEIESADNNSGGWKVSKITIM